MVGGLSIINAAAGAYSDDLPLLIISGTKDITVYPLKWNFNIIFISNIKAGQTVTMDKIDI